ncbi:NAD(P)-dependent oxidoreductase [Streptomyces sp. NPDC047022]|uniref:NAD(P)-dependent oxidoreductase n=1 Tax=Streptomyces sp. NPDC047022 TaxID=3155737 RepID=UPI0033C9FB0F
MSTSASPVRAVGFIGLGDQGAPMAQALASSDFELHVWARSSRSLAALEGHRHTAHPDPAALIKAVEVLALCVTDDDGVRSLVTSDQTQAVFRMGQIVVNHGTGDPDENRRISAELAESGVHYLDAPVSGGSPAARSRSLTTMVGGDADAFDACRPVFDVYSATVAHMGPVGAGQLTKLLNNSMTMSNLANAIDMVTIADGLGLDVEQVISVIGASSGASTSLTNLAATTDLDLAAHLQSLYAKDIEHFADTVRAQDLDPAHLHERGTFAAHHLRDTVATLARHRTTEGI